jgi:GAF domain-containing protein
MNAGNPARRSLLSGVGAPLLVAALFLIPALWFGALLLGRRGDPEAGRHLLRFRQAIGMPEPPAGQPFDQLFEDTLAAAEDLVGAARSELKDSQSRLEVERHDRSSALEGSARDLAYFRALVNHAPTLLLVIGKGGVVVEATGAAESFFGRARGVGIDQLLPGDPLGPEVSGAERQAVRPQGTTPVRVRSRSVESSRGKLLLVSLEDLSPLEEARRRAEDQATTSEELRHLVGLFGAGPNLAGTLASAAEGLRLLVGCDRIGVALPSANHVQIDYYPLLPPPPHARREPMPLPREGGALDQVLRSGEERSVPDWEGFSPLSDEQVLAGDGLRAHALFPLRESERIEGVLFLGFRRPGSFSPEMHRLVRHLLPPLTRAIVRSRAWADAAEAAAYGRALLDAVPVPLLRLGATGEIHGASPSAEQVLGPARKGRPIWELVPEGPERDKVRHAVARAAEGNAVRFETFLDTAEERLEVEAYLFGVGAGASQGLALLLRDITASHRRETESQERVREVDSLTELSVLLSGSLDFDHVMERVFDRALEITGLDRAWLSLFDSDAGELRVVAVRGVDREAVEALLRGTGADRFEDRVVSRRGPVVVENTLEDGRFPREAVTRSGVHSMIAVPLVFESAISGVLTVAGSRSYRYRARDVDLLGGFGRVFGQAIRNARAHWEVRRRAESFKEMAREQHGWIRALQEESHRFKAALTEREIALRVLLDGGPLSSEARELRTGFEAASRTLLGRLAAEAPTEARSFPALPFWQELGHRLAAQIGPDGRLPAIGPAPESLELTGDREALLDGLVAVARLVTLDASGAPELRAATTLPDGARPALDLALVFHSHSLRGSTAELTRAAAQPLSVPQGAERFLLAGLHLSDRVAHRSGAGWSLRRGEGNEVSFVLRIPAAPESRPEEPPLPPAPGASRERVLREGLPGPAPR